MSVSVCMFMYMYIHVVSHKCNYLVQCRSYGISYTTSVKFSQYVRQIGYQDIVMGNTASYQELNNYCN